MDQPDNDRSSAAINFFCAAFIVLVTLLLVSQLGNQTRWLKRADLVMQPGFFPAVGLLVMGVPALVLSVVSFRQMRSGIALESPRIIIAGTPITGFSAFGSISLIARPSHPDSPIPSDSPVFQISIDRK
ncbi:MAG: hypothetical protein CM1200mP39_31170 [Dehalococcoidia bacterium]|nr:MAG: hypothetical protein CM1200mP39_31170 [Dehalococcoidia bacterium]